MTRSKAQTVKSKIVYPHLTPSQPHQLFQLDIVPHFLQGGQRVACGNAIDVVSRYCAGLPFAQRRAQDMVAFLVHVWREMGVPTYTQVDNEGCFSGGTTHPHVLGQVVRLALRVGTELVFSPVYHPESNGYVERFHQEYDRHVWEDTYLSDLEAVKQKGQKFFTLYRQREDHCQLKGQTPDTLHHQEPHRDLPVNFPLPSSKLPLCEGRIHFMRQVSPEGTVRVLNANWTVPRFDPDQGVWVTLEFQTNGAMLSIFDAAPDAADRQCLTTHVFPLNEPVVPFPKGVEMETETPIVTPLQEDRLLEPEATVDVEVGTPLPADMEQPVSELPLWTPLWEQMPTYQTVTKVGERLLVSTINYTARFTRYVFNTMY